ncbi:MAG: response regulator [Armatimonadia bacterium]|nr:response regulator [Armatimonadia bacterium]
MGLDRNVHLSGDHRILMVDDDPAVVQVAQEMLRLIGYAADGFTDGAEALRALSRRPSSYDLLVTDLIMPRLTGQQVIASALRIKPQLPVLVTSGDATEGARAFLRGPGVVGVLTKPFSMAELAETVREVFGAANR